MKARTSWLDELLLLNTRLQGTVELGVKRRLRTDVETWVVVLDIFLKSLAAVARIAVSRWPCHAI